MIKGTTITMGEKEYTIAPLNFDALEKFEDAIDKFGSLAPNSVNIPRDLREGIIGLIHAAISRNHPDVTIEDIKRDLDLGNMREVFPAIMGMSGLVRGEAPAENV